MTSRRRWRAGSCVPARCKRRPTTPTRANRAPRRTPGSVGRRQRPPRHVPPTHARSHAPQWFASTVTSTQRPSHRALGALQGATQAPSMQNSATAHARAHEPQWNGSMTVSTHLDPQRVSPRAQDDGLASTATTTSVASTRGASPSRGLASPPRMILPPQPQSAATNARRWWAPRSLRRGAIRGQRGSYSNEPVTEPLPPQYAAKLTSFEPGEEPSCTCTVTRVGAPS